MSLRNIYVLSVVLLACMATLCQAESLQYANRVLADGAIGYWRLDDAAGQKTYVNSGSGGTALNGTSVSNKVNATGLIVTNPSDSAVALDGSSGRVISGTGLGTAGPGSTNVFAGDWTIEAWFIRTVQVDGEAVFSNSKAGNDAPVMMFFDSTHATKGTLGMMDVGTSWDGNFGIDLDQGVVNSSLNKPVYAVITKTGTNTVGTAKVSIYANIDGTWLTPIIDHTVGWTLAPKNGWYIGMQYDSGFRFVGTEDEVAIYASALSQSTIQNHYTLATVAPEPGTLVLLSFALVGLLCYAWRKRR